MRDAFETPTRCLYAILNLAQSALAGLIPALVKASAGTAPAATVATTARHVPRVDKTHLLQCPTVLQSRILTACVIVVLYRSTVMVLEWDIVTPALKFAPCHPPTAPCVDKTAFHPLTPHQCLTVQHSIDRPYVKVVPGTATRALDRVDVGHALTALHLPVATAA